MKRLLLFLLLLPFIGCSENQSNEIEKLKEEIEILNSTISNLRDSLMLYKYPASDRYLTIERLIKEDNLDMAESEINALVSLFPSSLESSNIDKQKDIIQKRRIAIKKEEERVKALGYKAFSDNSKFSIDYNNLTVSDLSFSNTFTFDSYGSHYMYRTADRGNKYVTARMTVSSENKNPNLPIFAVYALEEGVFKYVKKFTIEFARWDDYGTYLGNYHDNGNDFAKRSTISFKLGAEIDEKITSMPLLVVSKNENVAERSTDRFGKPPVKYSGTVDYPSVLSIDELNTNQYTVIKIMNRNKL